MKGSMSTDLGTITVSSDVIAKYAGTVAVECFGIVGMAAVNMKDGIYRLLRKKRILHMVFRLLFQKIIVLRSIFM